MKDDKVAQFFEKIKNLGEIGRDIERDIKQLIRIKKETGIDDENIFLQNFELLGKLCTQFFEQRDQIILEMAKEEYTNVKIKDNEIRKILTKIREEERFLPDLFKEKVVDLLNKLNEEKKEKVECSKNYLQDTIYEHLDELREEFESGFWIVDYYDRKLRVGPILRRKMFLMI